jgi:hypothetical protein
MIGSFYILHFQMAPTYDNLANHLNNSYHENYRLTVASRLLAVENGLLLKCRELR